MISHQISVFGLWIKTNYLYLTQAAGLDHLSISFLRENSKKKSGESHKLS